MRVHGGRPRSVARGLVLYGLWSLVPVLLLGSALAISYGHEAQRRGLAEGRSEALLVAHTDVEPLLDGQPLTTGLNQTEVGRALDRLVKRAVQDHHVFRLRLRDPSGRVVFSDDGSGFTRPADDEVLRAVRGETVALITHVNTDGNDSGPAGVASVEVYIPLLAGTSETRVGVLEMYLPYAPISADVATGMRMLYRNMALGLGLLWVLLLGTAWSVSRGLRRQMSINAFQAGHDSLTGLPNRLLFYRRATTAVRQSLHRHQVLVIAIVDLDRFKEVNDTLGHHNGDQLLAELAQRLAEHIRAGDTVARLGGDEFGVILRDCTDPVAALNQLRFLIVQPLEVNGLPLAVEASIGFVLAPDDGTEVDVLVQHADVAMYVAKEKHLGVVRYDHRHDHYDATKLTLVAELRDAIEDDQLVLHYQPKTILDDGRVDAVEALVRWQHPRLGLLPPDRFLPLAEQTELIDRLTTWVLERAAADMRALDLIAGGVSVAVNVSARNLAHADFARQVAKIIEAGELSADRLIVEITETALLIDPLRAGRVLGELTALGVRVSLDDFGSGQTSLGYLSALPIHELKIDKSFIEDMLVNEGHAAIVRSIVELGHNMSMQVVGEGVETADVLASLRATGCDVAQGFLFARPMPVTQLGPWLTNTAIRPEVTASTSRR